MEFEYDVIKRKLTPYRERYLFRNYPSYHALLPLLNKMGENGWEFIGQVEGTGLVVKRAVSEKSIWGGEIESVVLKK